MGFSVFQPGFTHTLETTLGDEAVRKLLVSLFAEHLFLAAGQVQRFLRPLVPDGTPARCVEANNIRRILQPLVDAELAQRGWPTSRADEARELVRLREKAAATGPKAGAGSLLLESGPDRHDEWMRRRLEDADPAAARATAVGQAPTSSEPSQKSNCWEVDAPPKPASGFSESQGEARATAMRNTKGCKIVSEMDCAKMPWDKVWDCRISYHCGEKKTVCEFKPAAGSTQ